MEWKKYVLQVITILNNAFAHFKFSLYCTGLVYKLCRSTLSEVKVFLKLFRNYIMAAIKFSAPINIYALHPVNGTRWCGNYVCTYNSIDSLKTWHWASCVKPAGFWLLQAPLFQMCPYDFMFSSSSRLMTSHSFKSGVLRTCKTCRAGSPKDQN